MIQVKPVPSAQSPHNKFYKGKREMEKEEKREFFFLEKKKKDKEYSLLNKDVGT